MQTIILPDVGAIKNIQIILFSKIEALLLCREVIFGEDDEPQLWTYFSPETGAIIERN